MKEEWITGMLVMLALFAISAGLITAIYEDYRTSVQWTACAFILKTIEAMILRSQIGSETIRRGVDHD